MPHITTPEHRQAVGKLRDLMATYHRSEDLIQIGAYARGTNPKLDTAIALKDKWDAFLKQSVDQNSPFSNTLEQLLKL